MTWLNDIWPSVTAVKTEVWAYFREIYPLNDEGARSWLCSLKPPARLVPSDLGYNNPHFPAFWSSKILSKPMERFASIRLVTSD